MVNNESCCDGQYVHRPEDERWPKLDAPWPKMPRGIDPEEAVLIFLLRSQIVHGEGRYEYPELCAETWGGAQSKIRIRCNRCGDEFDQFVSNHIRKPPLQSHGCPACAGHIPLTWTAFVDRANAVHDGKYDYGPEPDDWRGIRTRISIRCAVHGIFKQRVYSHLYDEIGCPQCTYDRMTMTWEEFVERATEMHSGRYEYIDPGVDWIGVGKSTITIICPDHGPFQQRAYLHLYRGDGCPIDGLASRTALRSGSWDEFVERATKRHKGRYEYIAPVGEWFGLKRSVVSIKCDQHGIFEQITGNHLYLGQGCPICHSSRGEMAIAEWLEAHGFRFNREVSVAELFGVDAQHGGRMRFDFQVTQLEGFVPRGYLIVENDGRQHREPIGFGGDPERSFAICQRRDRIKNELATRHGVILIRLDYDARDGTAPVIAQLEKAFRALGLLPNVE